MGSQNSLRTKYMTLVSKRKEVGHPDTVMTTRGSLSEKTVVESREPGSPQLSMARPRRLAGGCSVFDVPMP